MNHFLKEKMVVEGNGATVIEDHPRVALRLKGVRRALGTFRCALPVTSTPILSPTIMFTEPKVKIGGEGVRPRGRL